MTLGSRWVKHHAELEALNLLFPQAWKGVVAKGPDVILATPPCTPYSLAGVGGGWNDPGSLLAAVPIWIAWITDAEVFATETVTAAEKIGWMHVVSAVAAILGFEVYQRMADTVNVLPLRRPRMIAIGIAFRYQVNRSGLMWQLRPIGLMDLPNCLFNREVFRKCSDLQRATEEPHTLVLANSEEAKTLLEAKWIPAKGRLIKKRIPCSGADCILSTSSCLWSMLHWTHLCLSFVTPK